VSVAYAASGAALTPAPRRRGPARGRAARRGRRRGARGVGHPLRLPALALSNVASVAAARADGRVAELAGGRLTFVTGIPELPIKVYAGARTSRA
jgi:hypothetical protein